MKKNSILKALGIIFLLYVALSWIIPAGYYNSGEYVASTTAPVGIFDIILYPFMALTSSVFILTALDFLLIGAFYGILNKTKAYPKMVADLAKKFKDHKTVVLVVTTILFALLSSLTGLTLALFVFVPMCATVIMLMGYNKLTAMLSTVGAILVGNMASTYGFNVAGYIKYLTENINNSIVIRVALLVISVLVLVCFTIKASNEKEKNNEIKLYEKTTKKVSKTPVIVTMIVVFVILMVGMFSWSNVLGVELFNDIYNKIVGIKIGKYPIFANILGTLPAFGSWTNYELGLVLIIAGIVVGLIYKLSLDEIIEGAISGIKEMLPVALITILASTIFLLMNTNTNGYTFYATIINKLLGENIGIIPFGFITMIGSVFYNDFPYLLSNLYGAIVSFENQYVLIGMIAQTIHGLMQLILPTSVILVAGLTYFEIPYTKWLKDMWKFFLSLLIVIIILLILV